MKAGLTCRCDHAIKFLRRDDYDRILAVNGDALRALGFRIAHDSAEMRFSVLKFPGCGIY
jgi:hypothetical protein